jgi:CRISPR/Cas system endoribonuclease Cas6 (RAMP superfamily)
MIAKSKSSRLSYSEVVSLPLESILSKISRFLYDAEFQVHQDTSRGHNCDFFFFVKLICTKYVKKGNMIWFSQKGQLYFSSKYVYCHCVGIHI